jgi:hypothetical protein
MSQEALSFLGFWAGVLAFCFVDPLFITWAIKKVGKKVAHYNWIILGSVIGGLVLGGVLAYFGMTWIYGSVSAADLILDFVVEAMSITTFVVLMNPHEV